MDNNQALNPLDYSEILLLAHPVGSLYWSMEATDPAALFGGTWEQIKDQFVLAAGDTYKAGTSGGAASSVTSGSSAASTGGTAITVEQMPAHTHGLYDGGSAQEMGVYKNLVNNGSAWETKWREVAGVLIMASSGGGQAHTHTMAHTHTVDTMPPYTVAYCWRRTA